MADKVVRELTLDELDQVNGGVLPAVAAVYALASTTAARSIGWAIGSRIAAGYAVYSAAEYYG